MAAWRTAKSVSALRVEAFEVGEQLTVRAHYRWGDDSLGSFDCNVLSRGREVAAATLTVFQGDIDAFDVAREGGP